MYDRIADNYLLDHLSEARRTLSRQIRWTDLGSDIELAFSCGGNQDIQFRRGVPGVVRPAPIDSVSVPNRCSRTLMN
jgi:hypothetical protein